LKLAAGAGKSFIIILIALHYVKLKKTVTIVVPSLLLKQQMMKYTDLYIADEKV